MSRHRRRRVLGRLLLVALIVAVNLLVVMIAMSGPAAWIIGAGIVASLLALAWVLR